MHKYALGIDPGLSGAIAFVRPGDVHVFDMPVLEYKISGKKTRRELDCGRVFRIIKKYPVASCHLEAVAGMPGMGGTQMFTFGQSYGMIKAALALHNIAYELVSPRKWKNFYGLSKDKEASRETASQIFPEFKHLWARKKDDGRAESVLIGFYGHEISGLFTNL
jgi:crossover junction endodeoxyribonuclease RuvC